MPRVTSAVAKVLDDPYLFHKILLCNVHEQLVWRVAQRAHGMLMKKVCKVVRMIVFAVSPYAPVKRIYPGKATSVGLLKPNGQFSNGTGVVVTLGVVVASSGPDPEDDPYHEFGGGSSWYRIARFTKYFVPSTQRTYDYTGYQWQLRADILLEMHVHLNREESVYARELAAQGHTGKMF